jgi:CheY-like chemotaxis protein
MFENELILDVSASAPFARPQPHRRFLFADPPQPSASHTRLSVYGHSCSSEGGIDWGSQAMDTRKLKVLLVEDDKFLAEMYRLRLVAEGYDVRVANDGLSGLATALQRPPDLLLLDLRLPGLGGLDLLDQLRRSPTGADLPVIVLTNYGEMEIIDRGRALGVLEYLIKSQTTPNTLIETIKRHVPEGPPASTPT